MNAGFTLVELMISIALALLLIVGINKVFEISSQTVSAGNALGTIARDDRTAHTTIYADIKNAVTNLPTSSLGPQSPAFFIACSNVYAFRNNADYQSSNNNQLPSTRNDGTIVDATAVNDRSHRTDVMGFLAAGELYARQTANDGQYASATTSSQAYIWLGHVTLPNNALLKNPQNVTNGSYLGPGVPSVGGVNNDNNLFASDWILGRVAMLLVPEPTVPPPTEVYIKAGASGNPLGWDAISSAGGWQIYTSRYDTVNTTLSGSSTSFLWLEQALNPSPSTPAGVEAEAEFRDKMIYSNPQEPVNANPQSQQILRFNANPFVAKPLNSAAVAIATPIFIRSCAQFIVEFAGDYLTQDPNTGAVLPVNNGPANGPTGPDGIVDFTVDTSSGTPVHKIRWYGFPRDINGDGKIDINDVVPLRDLRGIAAGTPSSCERVCSFTQSAIYPGGTALAQQQYVCSWGPETNPATDPLPKMIRVTIALDDPNGRIANAQFFEYVIDLTQ